MTALLCLFMGGFSGADAHEQRGSRKVLVTVRPAAKAPILDAMIWIRVTGSRARRLIATYDLNRSGRFEASEATLVGNLLGVEAVGGFYVQQGKTRIKPTRAETQARTGGIDVVEVAALLNYPLSDVEALNLGLGADANRKRPDAPTLHAEVAVVGGLTFKEPGRLRGGKLGPVHLEPGGSPLEFTLAKAPTK
jgi:hypothetical protein